MKGQLLIENGYTLPDVKYEIMVKDKTTIGSLESTGIFYTSEEFKELQDDFINIEFDDTVSKADRKDYLIAASCGVLSGGLSVLWGKKFDFSKAHDWGNEKADDIVKSVAKSFGYKKNDLEGALRFLEKKFPMAGDALTNDFGGGKQHHLRDFSHHPTPIGLICSIMMQFTGKGLGTDTQGNIIHVKITKDGFIGETFADKIVFGTFNWILHLVSDIDGSSGSVLNGTGKGTGIPGPLLSLLKELSSLPIFSKVNESNINKPKVFSEYISKLFNGTLIKDKDGNPVRFDLRTEMGIGHFIVDQAKPVIINECLVRSCYFITRLIDEFKEKRVESVGDLNRLDPAAFMPFNNRALTRMLTVSSGTFVAINTSGTAVKSAFKSKGSKVVFCEEFFLSINYVGVGRFVFACAADSEYIKEDLKEVYDKWKQQREELKKNQYRFGYQFLSLNDKQARLLYSLKALAVEYDVNQTKNAKNKILKKEWLVRWKECTKKSLGVSYNDYFHEEDKTYLELYTLIAEENGKGWLQLLALELSLFQAYYPLSADEKDAFKGLKYNNKYFEEVFPEKQKLISKDESKTLIKTYKGYVSKLKENGKKAAITVAATAGATIATGGLALAFAPEIAVVLAGEAVAGLSGAALTSASLAAIGGGSLAAGGLGMAGGTAILTGGGALLGLAGSGSATLVSVLGQTSEQYTLVECAKLLTFCKVVLIDKFNMPEALNPIIAGIESCAEEIRYEFESFDKKEDKGSYKRIKSSLAYLTNCVKELDKLMDPKKPKNSMAIKNKIEQRPVLRIGKSEDK